MFDPVESLLLTEKTQEDLALEIEQVLLAHRELRIDIPPAERVGEPAGKKFIVFADEAAAGILAQEDLQLGDARPPPPPSR